MPESGAQPGNDNATRGMECRQALKRALSRKSDKTYREGLDLVMDEYVKAACGGESWAIRDIIDRLDGKAVQSVELTGADGGAVGVIYKMEFPTDGDDSASDAA